MKETFHARREVVIHLNPDGSFADPPQPPRPPLAERIMLTAIGIAVVAGGLALAAFAIASLFVLVPVALAAGALGYGAFRWRRWQLARGRP